MTEKNPPWPIEPSWEVCIDQCSSKCCRTPSLFLALKPEEEHLFKKYRIRNEIVVHDRGVPTKVKGRFFWFMDTNGRCPYLDTQGACSIYEDRPSACRTFPTEPVPGCLVWPPEWTRQMVPLPTPGLNDELPIGKLNT